MTSEKGKRILFVYTSFSTFVAQDYEILAAQNKVDKFQFELSKKASTFAWQFIRQFILLLLFGWKYDVFFIWFADYHSLLPVVFAKITGKRSILVVGGYDLNCLPEFKYGALNNKFRAFFSKGSFKHATINLPVAISLKNKLLKRYPNAQVIDLPTSQNIDRFNIQSFDREKIITTIALISRHQTMMVKGMDRFKELAEYMPDYHFTIIGIHSEAQRFFEPIPSNLELLPPIKHEELNAYLNRSSFYLQPSRSEGLPNALCEAMLCGCIPMGMNVGDVQEAIGPLGFVLDEWNPEPLSKFIRNFNDSKENRLLVRNWIITKYKASIRTERLQQIINLNEDGK